MPNLVLKIVSVSALAYASYTIIQCPCDKLVACHSTPFWASMIVAGGVILTQM